MKNKYEKLFDEFLNVIEFKLIRHETDLEDAEKGWGVYDLQGANLADIEDDRFETADDIFNRMGHYIDDYFLRDITELLRDKNIEVTWNENYEDYIKYAKPHLPENTFDFDILDMICFHGKEIDLSNCNYEVD